MTVSPSVVPTHVGMDQGRKDYHNLLRVVPTHVGMDRGFALGPLTESQVKVSLIVNGYDGAEKRLYHQRDS